MRLFVALPLPEPWRSPLLVAQFLLPVPRREPPENMHLTLCFLGEVADRQLDDLHDGLSVITGPRPMLRGAGLDLFGGARAHNLHLRIAPDPGLERLAARIARAARTAGLTIEARRFAPHVTLARFRPEAVDQARLSAAIVTAPPLDLPPVEVAAFTLFRSILRPDGARYHALAEYPLA